MPSPAACRNPLLPDLHHLLWLQRARAFAAKVWPVGSAQLSYRRLLGLLQIMQGYQAVVLRFLATRACTCHCTDRLSYWQGIPLHMLPWLACSPEAGYASICHWLGYILGRSATIDCPLWCLLRAPASRCLEPRLRRYPHSSTLDTSLAGGSSARRSAPSPLGILGLDLRTLC